MSRWQFRSESYYLRFDLMYSTWIALFIVSTALAVSSFVYLVRSKGVASLILLTVSGSIASLFFVQTRRYRERTRFWRERFQYVRRYGRPTGIVVRRRLKAVLALPILGYISILIWALINHDNVDSRVLSLVGITVVVLELLILREGLSARLPTPDDPTDDDWVAVEVFRREREKYRRAWRLYLFRLPLHNRLIDVLMVAIFAGSLTGALWMFALSLLSKITLFHAILTSLLLFSALFIGWLFLPRWLQPITLLTVRRLQHSDIAILPLNLQSTRILVFSRIMVNVLPVLFLLLWIVTRHSSAHNVYLVRYAFFASVFLRVVVAYLAWDAWRDRQPDEPSIKGDVGYGGLVYTDDGVVVPMEAWRDYQQLKRRRFFRRIMPIFRLIVVLILAGAIYAMLWSIVSLAVERDQLFLRSSLVAITLLVIGLILRVFGREWLYDMRDFIDSLRYGSARAKWVYDESHAFDPSVDDDDYMIDA